MTPDESLRLSQITNALKDDITNHRWVALELRVRELRGMVEQAIQEREGAET